MLATALSLAGCGCHTIDSSNLRLTNAAMDSPIESANNIEQVRDILFGTQLREYNGRLDRLESELTAFKAETHDRIDQTRDSLMMELRAISETMEKKLKSHDSSRQEEAESIRQAMGRVNQKLLNHTQQLDESLNIQVAGVRRDLLESREALQEAIRALRSQMAGTLDEHMSQVQNTKVSRHDMADVLMEFAMRLKGDKLMPDLSGGAASDSARLADMEASSNGRQEP